MDDVQVTQAESVPREMSVQLRHLYVRNFRCFHTLQIELASPYVLFAGSNGIGKTSLLEALYYACYLRSFRTHSPRELIHFGEQEFFVKIDLTMVHHPEISHSIQVGFSAAKRLVKIDQKSITSYKDLMAYYRIVSITENDLEIVQGSPQNRRLFLDQLLLLLDASYATILRDYRQVVEQRNALLQYSTYNKDTYAILTKQVWDLTWIIQERRKKILDDIALYVNRQGKILFHDFHMLDFRYVPKRPLQATFDAFMAQEKGIAALEQRFKRTLFGAHLDDMSIEKGGKSSRLFASRGQQKLIIMLLKMAQLELLVRGGIPGICLLDDFMTDFDEEHIISVLQALQGLGTQLIFTTPLEHSFLADRLGMMQAQTIKLTV